MVYIKDTRGDHLNTRARLMFEKNVDNRVFDKMAERELANVKTATTFYSLTICTGGSIAHCAVHKFHGYWEFILLCSYEQLRLPLCMCVGTDAHVRCVDHSIQSTNCKNRYLQAIPNNKCIGRLADHEKARYHNRWIQQTEFLDIVFECLLKIVGKWFKQIYYALIFGKKLHFNDILLQGFKKR